MTSTTCHLRLAVSGVLFAAALMSLPVQAEAALPAAPVVVSPAASSLVTSQFVVVGRVGPGISDVSVSGAVASTVTLLPADSEGATFTVQVRVAYGRTLLSLAAWDGASWSAPSTLAVWSLGKTPDASRFVLVDKSDLMLYVVRSACVVAAYPVAIGTRATPTPVGTRYLGRPGKSPNAVWGSFRMRLYKQALVRVAYTVRVNGRRVTRHHKVLKKVATKYYIHGTNDPGSIGTPASHGCVRLWNKNLRIFSTLTVKYELTVLRA